MADTPSDSYLEPYRRATEEIGAGFDATLWKNREWQRIRFDVLCSMFDLSGARIVDAGCGVGDLAAYLIDREVAFGAYVGVDGVGEQVEKARARGLARCRFEVGDFVHDPAVLTGASPDVVLFSGSLNTMDDSTAVEALSHAWGAAIRGIAFNFLSNRARLEALSQPTHPAIRHDTIAMIDWALKRSPRVRFRQDYLDGHDATIAVARI